MHRRTLGQLEVSAIGLGCGTMTPFYGEPDRAAGIATIRRAREIGVDLLDTADGYGRGRNEELVAEAVRGHRGDYVIASKFGNLGLLGDPRFADGRPEYVREACEKSLGRLKTDVIDLYYIHRVDPTVPIEDTIGAMSKLVREGKVRFLGICEAGAATIRRAHAVHPLAAVQIEYSLWTREVESEILPLCEVLGIGFVAYSPLGRGLLTGNVVTADAFCPTAAQYAAVSGRQSAAQPSPRRGIEGARASRKLYSGAISACLAIGPAAVCRAYSRHELLPPPRRERRGRGALPFRRYSGGARPCLRAGRRSGAALPGKPPRAPWDLNAVLSTITRSS